MGAVKVWPAFLCLAAPKPVSGDSWPVSGASWTRGVRVQIHLALKSPRNEATLIPNLFCSCLVQECWGDEFDCMHRWLAKDALPGPLLGCGLPQKIGRSLGRTSISSGRVSKPHRSFAVVSRGCNEAQT